MKKLSLFFALLFAQLLVFGQTGNPGAAHNAAVLKILPKLDLKKNKGKEIAHLFSVAEATYPKDKKDLRDLLVWVNNNSVDFTDPDQLLKLLKADKRINNSLHQVIHTFMKNSKGKSKSAVLSLIKTESNKSSGLNAKDDAAYKGFLDVFKHSIALWGDQSTIDIIDIDVDLAINWWKVAAMDGLGWLATLNPGGGAVMSMGAVIMMA